MEFAIPKIFNAASYFIDRNISEGRGENMAIECGERRVIYRELLENVNRFGNALRDLGVARGERAILVLPDIPEFAFAFFGAIKVGVVPIPVNPNLSREEYQHIFRDSGAAVLVTANEYLPHLRAVPVENFLAEDRVFVVNKEETKSYGVDVAGLLQRSSPKLEALPTNKDEVAFWLYSSGSTGFPKACVHRERDMVICAEHVAKGILGATEVDRSFSVSKLFFAYGLGNGLYFPLATGGTSILMPEPPTPERVLAILKESHPTFFYSVPANYAALLAHAETVYVAEDVFGTVRRAVSAGEPLPASLFERFKDRFCIELLDGIGSTEALQAFISNRPGDIRPGSSGKIVPGYDAKILDDHGTLVARGTIGNLWIKNDAICSSYWNQPEKTKDTIQDGWLRTGDVYYQDFEDYFWFVGRADDMFKSNGQWVSPVQIEHVIREHPVILEAAVVAKADADGLMKPAAFVVLKDQNNVPPDLVSDLKKIMAARLPRHKQARWVNIVPSLPKTATGKLQRYKLREANQ
jgi:benzoate-CoA ligase